MHLEFSKFSDAVRSSEEEIFKLENKLKASLEGRDLPSLLRDVESLKKRDLKDEVSRIVASGKEALKSTMEEMSVCTSESNNLSASLKADVLQSIQDET